MSKSMKAIPPIIDNGLLTRGFSEKISEQKKRRIPKPQKGIATDFLLTYGLPFLNLKEAEWKHGLFKREIKQFIARLIGEAGFSSLPVNLTGWDEKYEMDFFNLSEAERRLQQVQIEAKLLIKASKYGGFFKEIQNKEFHKKLKSLEVSFNCFFSKDDIVIPDIKLLPRKRETIKDQKSFNAVFIEALPDAILAMVIFALREGAYSIRENTVKDGVLVGQLSYLKSAAVAFIGMCPRCGVIFKQTRSDELYDRKTCQVQATKGNSKKI